MDRHLGVSAMDRHLGVSPANSAIAGGGQATRP
jgi:hypothetical protein